MYILQEFGINIEHHGHIGAYIDSYSDNGHKREYYSRFDAVTVAECIVAENPNAVVRIVKVEGYA